MKGKGKKGRDSDDECPLQLLDFEPLDHSRVCPRFAAGEFRLFRFYVHVFITVL